MEIVNLTPHPVTIVRPDGARAEYLACAPSDLPRAVEAPHRAPYSWLVVPPGDDTQQSYETACALDATGVVESSGYVGVENLPQPDLPADRYPWAPRRAYIVSIVTAIGALVAGRWCGDLLVPMGQVRDPETGRIIGATRLSPAVDLLDPLAARIRAEVRS